jgi:hypothetical protein
VQRGFSTCNDREQRTDDLQLVEVTQTHTVMILSKSGKASAIRSPSFNSLPLQLGLPSGRGERVMIVVAPRPPPFKSPQTPRPIRFLASSSEEFP